MLPMLCFLCDRLCVLVWRFSTHEGVFEFSHMSWHATRQSQTLHKSITRLLQQSATASCRSLPSAAEKIDFWWIPCHSVSSLVSSESGKTIFHTESKEQCVLSLSTIKKQHTTFREMICKNIHSHSHIPPWCTTRARTQPLTNILLGSCVRNHIHQTPSFSSFDMVSSPPFFPRDARHRSHFSEEHVIALLEEWTTLDIAPVMACTPPPRPPKYERRKIHPQTPKQEPFMQVML